MKIKIFDKKGFTLVELLIVVAIIGVLATLLMVNFVGVRQRARDAQRKSDLRQIQSALEIYRADNSSYPLAVSGLNSGCPASFTYNGTTYMSKVPCDPLGASYIFSSTGSTYSITACLENTNDSQKDQANACSLPYWSYTLTQP
ncbi:MAG: type II secretion system protein GspG [Patescibacteria group bacterium]|nr:type II secretion system protein GspG [Patescibacteria group bacterium]